MAKNRTQPTCEDCYFRRQGLCALPGDVVCPTFRAATAKALVPPAQPQLVSRAPVRVAVARAAA